MTDFAADIFVPLCIRFVVWRWFWTAKQQHVIGGGSTAQRAPHSQVLGSIPRPLHVLPGFSPGAAAAQSCVHWADWPLHTVQQVSVWTVVGPSELELHLQTQTTSLQHGQCRKLKLVDLISTPNIIRQHLSLIQMNDFPDHNEQSKPNLFL